MAVFIGFFNCNSDYIYREVSKVNVYGDVDIDLQDDKFKVTHTVNGDKRIFLTEQTVEAVKGVLCN